MFERKILLDHLFITNYRIIELKCRFVLVTLNSQILQFLTITRTSGILPKYLGKTYFLDFSAEGHFRFKKM